jgi:phage shock protein PspC (stress-responsive transcriptional regulator)
MGAATLDVDVDYTYIGGVFTLTIAGGLTEDLTIDAVCVKIWNVSVNVANGSPNSSGTQDNGAFPTFTLSAGSGYRLPAAITVTMGAATLDVDVDYTYIGGVFTLTIAGGLADDLTIDAVCVKIWTVSITVSDGGSVSPTVVSPVDTGSALQAYTLSAETGHRLPDTITVTMGGLTVDPSDYTYTQSSGAFTLNIPVIGDVIVTVTCVKTWTVSITVSDGGSVSPTVTSPVDTGSTLQAYTLSAVTGYRLPDTITVTMGGNPVDYTYTQSSGAFTLNVPVTGDIIVTVTCVKTWTVSITVSDGGSVSPAVISPVDTGSTLQAYTLSAVTGYRLPDTITVTMGGLTVDPSDYTYTQSSGAFTLNVPVIGDVIVTVTCVKTWTVSITVSDGGSVSPTVTSPVDTGSTLQAYTLSAVTGYRLPDTIIVTMGSLTVDPSDYTYTQSSGAFTLNIPVIGEVIVTVTCLKTWTDRKSKRLNSSHERR